MRHLLKLDSPPGVTIMPGQLYLGLVSGPVEGILSIVAVYIMTGIYGSYFSALEWSVYSPPRHLDRPYVVGYACPYTTTSGKHPPHRGSHS